MRQFGDDVKCFRCEDEHKCDTPDGVAIETYKFCTSCLADTGKEFSPRKIFDTLEAYKLLKDIDKRSYG